MLKSLVFISVFLLLPVFLVSQELEDVKIIEIVDANLFLLEDDRLIRMANLLVPSISSADSFFAKKVIKYFKKNLYIQSYHCMVLNSNASTDTLDVILYLSFPLENICYNEKYLERGFARYQNLYDLPNKDIYLRLENEARSSQEGIWGPPESLKPKPYTPAYNSILFSAINDAGWVGYDKPSKFWSIIINRKSHSSSWYLSIANYGKSEIDLESGSNLFLVSPRYEYISEYFGYQIGLIFLAASSGSGSFLYILPVGSLKFGLMDKVYFSADFVDESLTSHYSFDLTYHFAYPYGKVSIGSSIYSGVSFPTIKLQFAFLDMVLIDLKGMYDNKEKSGMFLGGLGFIFKL